MLYPIALSLSAFLFFVIQPVVAKFLLSAYGGTPAVWLVTMLFFQTLLLGAYAYTWIVSRFIHFKSTQIIYLILMIICLTLWPFKFAPLLSLTIPEFSILNVLICQLGLPLLLIGSTAPFLQFLSGKIYNKRDPYSLYVASNIGSLLALLSYPWIIERFSSLSQQLSYWNYGFIGYFLLMSIILINVLMFKFPAESNIKYSPDTAWMTKICWIGYSFIPCSLMLSVTFYITTDIAATPLFWIIPLSLYLLSFIVTFIQTPIIPLQWIKKNRLFFFALPIITFIVDPQFTPVIPLILIHLINFFIVGLLFHRELFYLRPSPEHLPLFYLYMALGGVLAGLFNSLLAPYMFNSTYEYPLVLLLTWIVLPLKPFKKTNILLMTVGPLTVGYVLSVLLGVSWFKADTILYQQRNFFGVKQVIAKASAHALIHQNTLHGLQFMNDTKNGALAYYAPMKNLVSYLEQIAGQLNTFIIGLGTGSMICHFNAQSLLQIAEIDEQVIKLANNPNLFSYLRDCPAQVKTRVGDGRHLLHKQRDNSLDLLVIDAFSSDAIPTHLLTLEAFQLYEKKLIMNGSILLNVSNRHIDLLPVVTSAGQQLDLIVLHKKESRGSKTWTIPLRMDYLNS